MKKKVLDTVVLETAIRNLGGQGFTPEGKADYREEYSNWSVQDLAAEYVRESFKVQLLLELLGERLMINQQEGTPL